MELIIMGAGGYNMYMYMYIIYMQKWCYSERKIVGIA
jgi:hypothetical protein